MDLPDSIISDILSRLPIDDIARCRCVCKCWNDLTTENHFRVLHWYKSTETYQPGDIDILLSDHSESVSRYSGNPLGKKLYFISNRHAGHWTIIKTPPPDHDISKSKVRGSCNGLLCLATRAYSCPHLVYNPITKERITLPVLDLHPLKDGEYRCGFGYDRINMKYKVVVTYYWKSYIDNKSFYLRTTGAILTVGESSWRRLEIPADVDTIPADVDLAIYHRDPLFLNGVFWWIIATEYHREYSSNPRIVFDGFLTLDISTEEISTKELMIDKFAPSLGLPISLDLIQLGNSVGLVAETMRFGIPSFEVRIILGTTTDGRCHYRYMGFDMHVYTNPFIDLRHFKLLCALGNSSFLFRATVEGKKVGRGYYESCHHLIIYTPSKHEGSIVKIAGVPKSFYPYIVSPSFMSPTM